MIKIVRTSLNLMALALLMSTNSLAGVTPQPKVKSSTNAAATNLEVDPAASTLTWNAKKVGGAHNGTVKLAKGSLEIAGKKLVGGNFTMDMTSIVNVDVANPEFNKKLTDHLKSEDFFSVEKNPTSTFKIIKATPISGAKAGEANYNITGNLTIKGITNPVSFPATVKVDGSSAEATAKIDIDRVKYDIKYRSKLLGTAADKIIDDTFVMDVKLVAGKSKTAKL